MVNGKTINVLCMYDDMTVEELKQRLWELFFSVDEFDDPLIAEMDCIIEALEEKQPTEYPYDAEEAWERFIHDCAEELEQLGFFADVEDIPVDAELCSV